MISLRNVAMDFLAQREHTQQELRSKLKRKGGSDTEIEHTLAELAAEGLQSDSRYAEQYVLSRSQKGYGSMRIAAELQQKGLTDEDVFAAVKQAGIDWHELINAVYRKKFKSPWQNYPDKMKRARFLAGRGFESDLINKVLEGQHDQMA